MITKILIFSLWHKNCITIPNLYQKDIFIIKKSPLVKHIIVHTSRLNYDGTNYATQNQFHDVYVLFFSHTYSTPTCLFSPHYLFHSIELLIIFQNLTSHYWLCEDHLMYHISFWCSLWPKLVESMRVLSESNRYIWYISGVALHISNITIFLIPIRLMCGIRTILIITYYSSFTFKFYLCRKAWQWNTDPLWSRHNLQTKPDLVTKLSLQLW